MSGAIAPELPGTAARAELRRAVFALAAGRGVANASLRWLPLFLPTIARALDSSLGATAAVMGVGELIGLSGIVTGAIIGRLGTRSVMVVGLALVATGNLIAGAGLGLTVFGIGYAALILGQSFCFLSGQTWIGANVPAAWRSRFLGGYESSWALSLLVGAPLAAVAVALRWSAPFWLFAALGGAGALALWRAIPAEGDRRPQPSATRRSRGHNRRWPLSRQGWAAVALAGALMVGNIALVVVSGAWLEGTYGFGARALGAVAFLVGAAELGASLAIARFGDRVAPRRSIPAGLALCTVAIAVIGFDVAPAAAAVGALAVFVLGFEFAFIATLTVAVQRPPDELPTLMGTMAASTTAARAVTAALGGWLFERSGIGAIALIAVGAQLVSLLLLGVAARAAPAAADG
ncbi:MAG: MFS transporter [Acidimicrobiales bacterium]|nr:MFS transporter [Acidimicrobiales bacterium]